MRPAKVQSSRDGERWPRVRTLAQEARGASRRQAAGRPAGARARGRSSRRPPERRVPDRRSARGRGRGGRCDERARRRATGGRVGRGTPLPRSLVAQPRKRDGPRFRGCRCHLREPRRMPESAPKDVAETEKGFGTGLRAQLERRREKAEGGEKKPNLASAAGVPAAPPI